jgi:hypothetical protein
LIDGKEGMSMDGRDRTAERGNDDMEDRRNMMGDDKECWYITSIIIPRYS